MNRNDLYQAVGALGDDLLARSEHRRLRIPRKWLAPIAAVLALALLFGAVAKPGNLIARAYAVSMPKYPTGQTTQDYDTWKYASEAFPFFEATYQQLLSGDGEENRVYSPLNLYMALTMLCELSGGNTRQQLLDLLGSQSQTQLRELACRIWNDTYSDNCILANSIWMDNDISYVEQTMQTLSESYYASAFHGKMGSGLYDQALRGWINQQTGGKLRNQTAGLRFTPNTVLALVSTVLYDADWGEQFQKSDTSAAVFHSPTGDYTCDFMHSGDHTDYYWGNRFAAAGKAMKDSGGMMLLILPDEGVDVQELLRDSEVLQLIRRPQLYENQKNVDLTLSLPKFDISSKTNLKEHLEAMGITDAFTPALADFTPAFTDARDLQPYISDAIQTTRFQADEEGAYGISFFELDFATKSAPPDGSVELNLDRPFLFVLLTDGGLPLFAGIVNQP